MGYAEEEYLMLSEIQHYVFCPRQWGLIHLEQHWQENVLTVEGNALHERAHDENIKEKRGNKIIVRGIPRGSYGSMYSLLSGQLSRRPNRV